MSDVPRIRDLPVGIGASGHRRESDSMGVIDVPADRYWGAQTQRSLLYFGGIGADPMPPEVCHALGEVKKAAALANGAAGRLPPWRAELIARVADEVISGELDGHFPLRVWQTGSGTQTNMNVNEVIANRAIQLAGGVIGSKDPVHPNDHVNMGQSSNDTFPTAMHIAAVRAVREEVIPNARVLRDAIHANSVRWRDVVKIGRTHLQDAVPLTVGQEWSGWARQLEQAIDGLDRASQGLFELAAGGTAVGTGLNAPPGFGAEVAERIAAQTGYPFTSAANKFAALAGSDAVAAASAGLRGLAVPLAKIANDIRWLGSGPRSGLGELLLPPNEPGSSIMPGKVNPTQCEAMLMVCARVLGDDTTIAFAASQGNLELNTMRPVIIASFLRSATVLAGACRAFRVFCVEGIALNEARVAEHVGRSLMLVTALSPVIGYDRAAEIAHKADRDGGTLREAALSLGYISAQEFDRVTDPASMTGDAGPLARPWLGDEMAGETYDVIVLGAGPTGENVADRAVRGGLTAAIVEAELVGGECSYWACMPSKALLRPVAAVAEAAGVRGVADARLVLSEVLARRDRFAAGWQDDGQVSWLASAKIDLYRGHGRITGERAVLVGDTRLRARHAVVVATGSGPVVPRVLADVYPWTSREATSAHVVPQRLAIVGGGVVGCEMAAAWSALGSRVTLLSRGRLLDRLPEFAGELVAAGLRDAGVTVQTGVGVTGARRDGWRAVGPGGVGLTLDDGTTVEADEVLAATGRAPRTADIGLDAVELSPGSWLEVDDTMRVSAVRAGWLYAAGDVNHLALLTHMGKYQGRVCGDAIAARAAGREPAVRDIASRSCVPQVVFTIPEVAAVGLSAAQAQAAGRRVRVVEYEIGDVAGARLHADGYRGHAQLVVDEDRQTIAGMTLAGPGVGEMIHAATVAVAGEVPLSRLWHAVPSYPTMSELWLRLLEAYGL